MNNNLNCLGSIYPSQKLNLTQLTEDYIKQSNTITFNNDNKLVGTLDLKNRTFTGDVDASAKAFFDTIIKNYDEDYNFMQKELKRVNKRNDELLNEKYLNKRKNENIYALFIFIVMILVTLFISHLVWDIDNKYDVNRNGKINSQDIL